MGILSNLGKKVTEILDPPTKTDNKTEGPPRPDESGGLVTCPACGFKDSGQFCSQCGSPLHSMAPEATKPRKKPMKNDSALDAFHHKVAGVTFPNDDGSSRQEILKKCKVGEQLRLIHAPFADHPNAVKVLRSNGQQIGWLPSELADEIAPRLQRGSRVDCVISDLTGGTRDKKTRGCNIQLTKYSMR